MATRPGDPPRRTRRNSAGKRKAGLEVPSEETLIELTESVHILREAIASNVNPYGQERSVGAFQRIPRLFGPDLGEAAEISRIIGTFDSRLTEAEKRIDRVLARLGVE